MWHSSNSHDSTEKARTYEVKKKTLSHIFVVPSQENLLAASILVYSWAIFSTHTFDVCTWQMNSCRCNVHITVEHDGDDKRHVSIKLRWKWQTNGMKHLVWLFESVVMCGKNWSKIETSRVSESKECKWKTEYWGYVFNALQIVALCAPYVRINNKS